ncbi:zinc finger domain containing protein [Acanthamoeba castellanii str. Neff]|uniref:Zinc finger domain containing protein n=1 Tax=Acanthamoeba castellanii (strain ATCC 30010 / Neff) TaxID=1257118 RepID=L8GMW7_ACACF|nr:zinc finger domain containing protein [Acanthamoeba castellanii str. Neff]ELR14083.1 zinc finger domain containing protein [Acanthamoeba castellanii str. Neff]
MPPMMHHMADSGKRLNEVCRDYRMTGRCSRGSRCIYIHAMEEPLEKRELCRDFSRGYCARGDLCPYSHRMVDDAPRDVCRDFMRGLCTRGSRCPYMHIGLMPAPPPFLFPPPICPYLHVVLTDKDSELAAGGKRKREDGEDDDDDDKDDYVDVDELDKINRHLRSDNKVIREENKMLREENLRFREDNIRLRKLIEENKKDHRQHSPELNAASPL